MTRHTQFVVGLAAVVGVALVARPSSHRDTGTTAPRAAVLAQAPIPRIIVQSWDMPRRRLDGSLVSYGNGYVIVIDTADATPAGLRRLGDQLHAEAPGSDQVLLYEVFDDSLSASRRQRGIADELPREQQRRFDRHYVGAYLRNPNSRHESWVYAPSGIPRVPEDSLVTVNYAEPR